MGINVRKWCPSPYKNSLSSSDCIVVTYTYKNALIYRTIQRTNVMRDTDIVKKEHHVDSV